MFCSNLRHTNCTSTTPGLRNIQLKKYLFLCFCTALVLPTATAQSVRFHQNLQTYVSVDSSMGYYLPAFDTVWSLVVFVNYPKAALHSDSWPHGTKQLPSFAKKTVAPDLTSMDPDSSLTGYLHEASLGRLTFIGQTFPEVIQPEHDIEYYNNNGQLGAMVYEALDRVNKSGLINWEALDRWSKVNGKYHCHFQRRPYALRVQLDRFGRRYCCIIV